MARFFAATNPEITDRELRNMDRARKIAVQGMVLLSNNGALPLVNSTGNLALFGSGARRTVKGGTGSGDVNSRTVINVEQGLESAGFTVTTKAWLDRCDQTVEEAKAAYFTKFRELLSKEGANAVMRLFTDPFMEPAAPEVTSEDIKASDTDTAIYVIARNSGEGRDRKPSDGEYGLFESEKASIRLIAESYKHVIIVLNVGSVIDTAFLRSQQGIGAILLMSQAGNIGGYALADVLTGKETPSGKLTTTWAQRYEDYPMAESFSHMNKDTDDEYYREGIYVGYRYFDTFNVTPAYPFGYGLSYTSFAVHPLDIAVNSGTITVKAEVKNTGKQFAGKEVVQIYCSAPAGKLEKPYQELAAYGKTGRLNPGESEVLTLSWPLSSMASYDEETASWVLEAGSYYIRIGTDSRNTHVMAAVILDQDAVTEKLSNRLALDCDMELLSSKGITPYGYEQEDAEKEAAPRISVRAAEIPCHAAVYQKENPEIHDTGENRSAEHFKITMDDVKDGRYSLDDLTAQLSVAEMAELCVGTARGGLGGTSVVGAASAVCPGAAGDTTSLMLEDRNIRNIVLADGPAGLRLSRNFMADQDGNVIPGIGDAAIPGMELVSEGIKPQIPENAVNYYQYCTAVPIATLLAQTWDVRAIEEAGDIVGEEMEQFGITLWLAPGMNIHRNPLCGRNFEYYSEDPLVAGLCAAADTRGVQKHPGAGTTIKHFAFNNQEDNRMHVNAHINERAIREIYLKCFEIAVRLSQPMSIMTSYNLINGTHTANSYDLLTAIARDEWGFQGIIMTDWGTTGSIEMNPGLSFKYGCSSAAGCIRAGNDLVMPGSQQDIDEIIRSVDSQEAAYPITLGDLQACTKRILNIIRQSLAYEDARPYEPSDMQ